ncbi:MAG: FtsW/RodA/SpoVE family cell cycle protein [Acidimicrobiales bacterium]
MNRTSTSSRTRTSSRTATPTRTRNSGWSNRIHRPLAAVTLGIGAFGSLMAFSAGRGPTGDLSFGIRQVIFFVVGSLAMLVVAVVDYRRLQRWYPLLLSVAVAALALVLTPVGTEVRGTQGWFQFGGLALQPSEFAKLTLIVGLAVILQGAPRARTLPGVLRQDWQPSTSSADREKSQPATSRFALSVGLLGIMSALVLAQGESGTVLVYCAIALGMMTVAGIEARYLVLLTASGVIVIGLALSSGMLAEYQVDRFEAFLDADLDPQGIGYNQQQALTAIGSGGLLGAGLFDGPQTQLGYLPDQHTDFIFAAVAEELGFVGALAVLILEAGVLASIFVVGLESRDRFAQLLCAGVFSFLAFQVFQNVAMNLRMMPITGISLPFVSYGGSSLVTSLLAVGLVQSVAVNRGSDHRLRPT